MAMLQEVMTAPLPGMGKSFRLADVTAADRLNELEFHCPLKSVHAETVAAVLKRHGQSLPSAGFPERIGELQFKASGGLLTGFIDLVARRGERFYLLDWKSNWLGNAFADYAEHRLATAMTARLYPLQYLLYTVALDRWLRTRLGSGYAYEKNFGGVFYLFLRGVNREHPGAGVFADRPPRPLIEELGEALLAQPAREGGA
jgi:exodeoxyribonuclease V beta subunit